MPLVVPCPSCAAKLSAPESAVGKQIRCPKCGAVAAVPAPAPVVEAKVADPPKPRPKPVQAEVAEERPRKASLRDDDEDERPRKKKKPRYADDDDEYDHDRKRKPKQKAGGGGVVAAAVVMGCLLLLVGIIAAVYLLTGKSSLMAKKAPVPDGWEQYSYPQDGFKVCMPKGATYASVPADGWRRDAIGFNGPRNAFGVGGWNNLNDLPEAERVAFLSAGGRNATRAEVYVARLRDRVPSSIHAQMRRGVADVRGPDVQLRKVTWLGNDAVEQTVPGGVMRVVFTERHVVFVLISGANGGRARPEEEAAFFDNFEVTD